MLDNVGFDDLAFKDMTWLSTIVRCTQHN